MGGPQATRETVRRALEGLGIDVPYTLRQEGGRLVFYLYGGGVRTWPPEGEAIQGRPAAGGRRPASSRRRAEPKAAGGRRG